MEWNILRELRRKLMHIAIILIIVLYSILENSVSKQIALFTLVFILLFLLAAEFIRLELNIEVPIIKQLIKAKEERRMHGAIYFLTATIISLAVFDFKIALAALLMTVFGDMAAALVGKRFGRTWLSEKRALEGILAELFVNLAIAYFILNSFAVMIVMALTATVVESLVDKLDDNLMIPLFAGFNGQLALYILNFLG